ncbi:CysB family HTH-type transcriptional regulator [Hyphomicrobium sp. LHD-15]|uniref:CysB family HTH-type transcriptional regulator n=1 Tax=Hyphomicrobium sp. LHD-15 TaxID=3072142 RepID=UPI00280FB7C5|nr:CysB family HTH-type transcriptional regulator [Hyphomicrobium sp. LHD-15]MDQ8697628.1 CysB family HTH-type transcriptional regulator [Hyphomicrobium sp. LHD-15]
MNLQQLRIIRETVRAKFNVTEAANAIYASQSGVSKQIRDLEEELGVALFRRRGKRLLGLTELGEEVVRIADRVLLEAENIKQAASQFAVSDRGQLEIATTHTQARYVLPDVILKFKQQFPGVRLMLHQASPRDIGALLNSGSADLAIATDAFNEARDIISFPYYSWQHIVVVPAGHPLDGKEGVTLEEVAAYPIVTYDNGLTGRPRIDEAFDAQNLSPEITMTALDADVIKAYVALGLGVGIIAPMSFNEKRDTDLRQVKLREGISPSTTSIALRRGRLHRGYVYRFIELCTPSITEKIIREADAAVQGDDD